MKYNDNGLWKTLNIKVTDTLPVGTIIPFAGTTLPANYMLCDGTAISRIEYPSLYAAIGTAFGSGDGSTTFNLPNIKGRVLVGQDTNDTSFDAIGEKGGEKTHTLTVDEMPSHSHNYYSSTSTSDWPSRLPTGSNAGVDIRDGAIQSTGGDQPHNNLQPYIVVKYIIKVLDAPASGIRSETLPVGTVIDYEGDTIPVGWEEITNPDSYSTNEVKTNKVWIDGKPIYRKVFNRGNDISSFNHNIANVDLIWIDSTHSIRKHLSGNVFNIVGGTNDSSIKLAIYVNDTEVHIDNIGNLSPSEIYITLEYTKTTD